MAIELKSGEKEQESEYTIPSTMKVMQTVRSSALCTRVHDWAGHQPPDEDGLPISMNDVFRVMLVEMAKHCAHLEREVERVREGKPIIPTDLLDDPKFFSALLAEFRAHRYSRQVDEQVLRFMLGAGLKTLAR